MIVRTDYGIAKTTRVSAGHHAFTLTRENHPAVMTDGYAYRRADGKDAWVAHVTVSLDDAAHISTGYGKTMREAIADAAWDAEVAAKGMAEWNGVTKLNADILAGRACPDCHRTYNNFHECECTGFAGESLYWQETAADMTDETADDSLPAALTADTDYGWMIPESRDFAAKLAAELGKPGFFAHDDFAIRAIECIVQARAALAAYDIEVFSEARDGVPASIVRRLTDITRMEAGKLAAAWNRVAELCPVWGITTDDAADAIAAIAPIGHDFHEHPLPSYYVRICMD